MINGLQKLPLEDLFEEPFYELESLAQFNDQPLGLELQNLDKGFDVNPAQDDQGYLDEVRNDKALEIVRTHGHDELKNHKCPRYHMNTQLTREQE